MSLMVIYHVKFNHLSIWTFFEVVPLFNSTQEMSWPKPRYNKELKKDWCKDGHTFSNYYSSTHTSASASSLMRILHCCYLLTTRHSGGVVSRSLWVIPCQLTHFFPGPSPILMKFGRLVDPPERLAHTKSQLIIIIIDEATALQRFLKFIKIFEFGTQNIL